MIHDLSSIGRLSGLVSSEVGVIRSLSPVVRGADEPNPPILYQAMLSHFDYRVAKDWERVGVGKGSTPKEAMFGAIAEAVEHYCAAHFDTGKVVRATWAEVSGKAIAPTEFVLYSEKQYAKPDFPYRPWNAESSVGWLPVKELTGGDQRYVPATLVYLSLGNTGPSEFFCPPTSNGLAAGPDPTVATLHGLLELIERDAFLITWLNRLAASRVEVSYQTKVENSILEHYKRFGITVSLFDISTDLLPYVMMAVAEDRRGDGPAAVVGLGCHLSPIVAARKALFELCQAHPGEVRRFREEKPSLKLTSYQDVRSLEDHSAFFHPRDRLEEFSFLLNSSRTVRLDKLPNRSDGDNASDLENCLISLTERGSRVFCADLTTYDIIPYGFSVVRTLATGLQPMHFGFAEERLGGSRLFVVPKKLGYCADDRTPEELNCTPHPLA